MKSYKIHLILGDDLEDLLNDESEKGWQVMNIFPIIMNDGFHVLKQIYHEKDTLSNVTLDAYRILLWREEEPDKQYKY